MSAFHSAETLLQGVHQLHAAAGLGQAYRGLTANPSAQTAWSFGGKVVGVIGTERVVGQLVKFGVRMAIKSHGVDQSAAEQMVETMKSRVPVDTGRLVSGITYSEADGMFTVEASAARDGDADYARFVEFGTKASSFADADYFAAGSDSAGADLRKRGHYGDTRAQPFFWNSAKRHAP
jgi:HK97 gp10 family phage protein